jgi:predicted regulator of Ras-like GTPase activity (Roadblock/LC7/MglB family)
MPGHRVSIVDDANGERQLLRSQCQAFLDELIARSPAVLMACLGTVDGRVFAYAGRQPEAEPQHHSALTSSLLALSESLVKDTLRSRCTYTVVAAEHGAIVTVRVPSRSRSHALSIGADSTAVLGATLRTALDASDALARMIDRSA